MPRLKEDSNDRKHEYNSTVASVHLVVAMGLRLLQATHKIKRRECKCKKFMMKGNALCPFPVLPDP